VPCPGARPPGETIVVSTPKRRVDPKAPGGAGNNRDRGRDSGANEVSVEWGAETGVDLKVSSG
jgi:hypothetical protein